MIKTSFKQTGSAHIVIVVVLIVALLGALGFTFWQNFTKKDNAANVANSKTNDEDKLKGDARTFRDNAIGIEFTHPKDWIKVECDDTNTENLSQYNVYFGTTNEGLAIVDGKSTQLCERGSDFAPQMIFALRKDIGDEDLYLEYGESSTDAMIDGVQAKKYVSRTDSNSIVPGLESTTYVVRTSTGFCITATYNRFPQTTAGSRDNSEAGLRAFTDVVEKSLHFLRTEKQVE